MRLTDYLLPQLVVIAPPVRGRDELIRLFGELFFEQGWVEDANEVVERLLDREAIMSTGIGGGVAVPHAQLRGLGRLLMAASTHPEGIDYPALDGEPVRLVFCLLGDAKTTADHLAGLARLARLARRGGMIEGLVGARSGDELLSRLARLEES